MKSTSEYWFERNDNSRSAVQQKYFLQRNEPRGKLDKPHPSRSLNKDKKCDWKPLAPKIFAFVGMLLVFLVVNLICALPLFCFEKATREREKESSYLSKYLSCLFVTLYRTPGLGYYHLYRREFDICSRPGRDEIYGWRDLSAFEKEYLP